MKLVTLQRQAPVAPDARTCRLCDVPISGALQDHLLAGQPGLSRLEAATCHRCGEVLCRVIEVFGPELCFLVQEHRPSSRDLARGPVLRDASARAQSARDDVRPLDKARERQVTTGWQDVEDNTETEIRDRGSELRRWLRHQLPPATA
jgi:hypothetical protein